MEAQASTNLSQSDTILSQPNIPKNLRSFVGGSHCSSSGGRVPVHNPATNAILCEMEQADESVLEKAVSSALSAQKIWASMRGLARGRILQRAARIIESRLEEIACAETLDCGKPITESRTADLPAAIDTLDYYGGLAGALRGEQISLPEGNFAYTRCDPLGVCAAIGAWNYPLMTACFKTIPALACGNSVIYKPSELAPVHGEFLAEILHEAGLAVWSLQSCLWGRAARFYDGSAQ